MDKLSDDTVVSIIGYGGVALYGKVNTWNTSFKIASSHCASSPYVVKAMLNYPLNPFAVCNLLNCEVRPAQVEDIINATYDEDDSICRENIIELIKVAVLKLALFHFHMSRPHPHSITGQEVIEIFLRSVCRPSTPDHPIAVHVLRCLTSHLGYPMTSNISESISEMLLLWRYAYEDYICIRSPFLLFYRPAMLTSPMEGESNEFLYMFYNFDSTPSSAPEDVLSSSSESLE